MTLHRKKTSVSELDKWWVCSLNVKKRLPNCPPHRLFQIYSHYEHINTCTDPINEGNGMVSGTCVPDPALNSHR